MAVYSEGKGWRAITYLNATLQYMWLSDVGRVQYWFIIVTFCKDDELDTLFDSVVIKIFDYNLAKYKERQN